VLGAESPGRGGDRLQPSGLRLQLWQSLLMYATATALRKSLDAQRDHVLGILDGLGDDELNRPILPTAPSPRPLQQPTGIDAVPRRHCELALACPPGWIRPHDAWSGCPETPTS
jgi:hypothetical protein